MSRMGEYFLKLQEDKWIKLELDYLYQREKENVQRVNKVFPRQKRSRLYNNRKRDKM